MSVTSLLHLASLRYCCVAANRRSAPWADHQAVVKTERSACNTFGEYSKAVRAPTRSRARGATCRTPSGDRALWPTSTCRERSKLILSAALPTAHSFPICIIMEADLPSLDQLRSNAAECIRLAEAARTSQHKSLFIEMAERWLTLAERAENTQAR